MVTPSPATPLSFEYEAILGASGVVGVVGGIFPTTTADAALVLPATSAAFAVKLWLPVASVPVVRLHAPLLFAVAVPIWFAPSNTFTVLLASAVPVRFTVPFALLDGVAIVGAFGAVVSIFTARAAEAAPVCPDASVAFAVRL